MSEKSIYIIDIPSFKNRYFYIIVYWFLELRKKCFESCSAGYIIDSFLELKIRSISFEIQFRSPRWARIIFYKGWKGHSFLHLKSSIYIKKYFGSTIIVCYKKIKGYSKSNKNNKRKRTFFLFSVLIWIHRFTKGLIAKQIFFSLFHCIKNKKYLKNFCIFYVFFYTLCVRTPFDWVFLIKEGNFLRLFECIFK